MVLRHNTYKIFDKKKKSWTHSRCSDSQYSLIKLFKSCNSSHHLYTDLKKVVFTDCIFINKHEIENNKSKTPKYRLKISTVSPLLLKSHHTFTQAFNVPARVLRFIFAYSYVLY